MEHAFKFHLGSYQRGIDISYNDISNGAESKLKDEIAKRRRNAHCNHSHVYTYPHWCSQPQEVLWGGQLSDPLIHPGLQEKSMSFALREKPKFFLVDFQPFSDWEIWQI